MATRSTLTPHSRRHVERVVVEARGIAEAGARAALKALAVPHGAPYDHMEDHERHLRGRLRAHARQLGDQRDDAGTQTIEHLAQECAYEHWHSMLFARFLAENGLLIEPEVGVAVTLDDCEKLAVGKNMDKWRLAAHFARAMLPQVFQPDLPVFEVRLAQEYHRDLEALVTGLPTEVFAASDALGWLYQFWQSRKKADVNQSETKIGADELPAVTQLFTEPYMVRFLMAHSLGAWWAQRFPERPSPLGSLRPLHTTAAEARRLDDWPDDLAALKVLDPCCGSGHFLVAAFLNLVPMRMVLEDLTATKAIDAVLRDNLHGLELDRRCVAIAAFALALEAWRYPGAGGFRPLPRLRLAWCGQPVASDRQHWVALVGGDARREAGMVALHQAFAKAPVLGSLVDPSRSVGDLLTADFADLQLPLQDALQASEGNEELEELAVAAHGVSEAAQLLTQRYHLVLTNVPYLGREKHTGSLRDFCQTHYPLAKHDLATVFLERLFGLCEEGGELLLVLPRNWLFLARYKGFRKRLLKERRWRLLATLGSGAFETITGEVVNTCLLAIGSATPKCEDEGFAWLDVSERSTPAEKASALERVPPTMLTQASQLANPDAVVGYAPEGRHALLASKANSYQGLATSDNAQFVFCFWEVPAGQDGWEFFQFAPTATRSMSGCSHVIFWQDGHGKYAEHATALKAEGRLGGWRSGHAAWGKRGIAINRMGDLPASLYFGTKFDCNVAVLVPNDPRDLAPLWAYCSSPQYNHAVRAINKKVSVTNGTLAKVPYDAALWQDSADGCEIEDLSAIDTDDPTQWGFHGHPRPAYAPLQVAMARLLGYRWPAESAASGLALSAASRRWMDEVERCGPHVDEDGIVCLQAVLGERPAHERLLDLLAACWGKAWDNDVYKRLLAETTSRSLEDWLRRKFFADHCKLFHNRPFLWHIWDGRADGFHAFVNYHKLAADAGRGRRVLEKLTYSYLGDWMTRQQDASRRGETGADERLAAALALQTTLAAILEGEAPYDIFVRWKPIEQQPVGWAADVDDGVRLNIRPFMAQDIPGGRRGAGILRVKPNIHWKKDKGREARRNEERFPWFWQAEGFTSARVNDVHLSLAEKRGAQTVRKGATGPLGHYERGAA